jgi:hypothetical protein
LPTRTPKTQPATEPSTQPRRERQIVPKPVPWTSSPSPTVTDASMAASGRFTGA